MPGSYNVTFSTDLVGNSDAARSDRPRRDRAVRGRLVGVRRRWASGAGAPHRLPADRPSASGRCRDCGRRGSASRRARRRSSRRQAARHAAPGPEGEPARAVRPDDRLDRRQAALVRAPARQGPRPQGGARSTAVRRSRSGSATAAAAATTSCSTSATGRSGASGRATASGRTSTSWRSHPRARAWVSARREAAGSSSSSSARRPRDRPGAFQWRTLDTSSRATATRPAARREAVGLLPRQRDRAADRRRSHGGGLLAQHLVDVRRGPRGQARPSGSSAASATSSSSRGTGWRFCTQHDARRLPDGGSCCSTTAAPTSPGRRAAGAPARAMRFRLDIATCASARLVRSWPSQYLPRLGRERAPGVERRRAGRLGPEPADHRARAGRPRRPAAQAAALVLPRDPGAVDRAADGQRRRSPRAAAAAWSTCGRAGTARPRSGAGAWSPAAGWSRRCRSRTSRRRPPSARRRARSPSRRWTQPATSSAGPP